MAESSFYLRPSADISLNHTVVPADLSAGYLAISEEISDNSSTYISGRNGEGSIFELSGNIPSECKAIKGGIIYLDFTKVYIAGNQAFSEATIKLYVNEKELGSYYSDSVDNYVSFVLTQEDIISINQNISSAGVFPKIWVYVKFDIFYETTSDGKGGGEGNLTQLYIEFEYTENKGFFKRINGKYLPARVLYQKNNGTWAEITEDETKTILKNNTIRPG